MTFTMCMCGGYIMIDKSMCGGYIMIDKSMCGGYIMILYNDHDNDNEFYFQFVQVALYYTIYNRYIYN